MTNAPTLYIGAAAPLVEDARLWVAKIPPCADRDQFEATMKAFPHRGIGAYGLAMLQDDAVIFRTGASVSRELVTKRVAEWSGEPPQETGSGVFKPVTDLDHRRALSEIARGLNGVPVRVVRRIGLTLQRLQDDVTALRPQIVLLDCHGTDEGCMLFEDGRGGADFVSGDRVFEVLRPRPAVLALAACRSECVLRRAREAAEWGDGAIVYVVGDLTIEVPACVAFHRMFLPAVLRGDSAGEAFDAAVTYVRNDLTVGRFHVDDGGAAPADKFRINDAGRAVRLPPNGGTTATATANGDDAAAQSTHSTIRARSGDRFVGRRREMHQALDALLPRPAGVHISPGAGERRLVTLTKEGGIGKTSIADQCARWAAERGVFTSGVIGESCEFVKTAAELTAKLLTAFGVPPEAQRGDLLRLMHEAAAAFGSGDGSALLVLDNLDELVGKAAPADVRRGTHEVVETLLTAAPDLRILATCRWPVGLAHHEVPIEVTPLEDEEARDVFISYLVEPRHRAEAAATWDRQDSAVRGLVELSGRAPNALELLAAQMKRPGMTFERLRDAARENLMEVLRDPDAADSDTDRHRRVEATYALSYRFLSEPARRLFGRLSRLPGGVWHGELADRFVEWDKLLGADWAGLMEHELDYYSLVHYEADPAIEGRGTYRMLAPMLEFARKKLAAAPDAAWDEARLAFWREKLAAWNGAISGRIPDDAAVRDEDRAALSFRAQQLGVLLFDQTQANWRDAFDEALTASAEAAKSMLRDAVTFCELSGQRPMLRAMAADAARVLRGHGDDALLAPCLGTLGNVLRDLGMRPAARAAYEEALAIRRRLAKQHPAAFEQHVATTLNNLGNVLSDLGERPAARAAYEEALAIRRRLVKQHPAAFEPHMAMTLNNLGAVLRDLGERPAARAAFEEALAIRRRLAKQHPAAFEQDVAATLSNLGAVLSELGERPAARSAYEEALAIFRRLAEQHPAAFVQDVATTLNNLGNVLRDLGERPAARSAYEQALGIYHRLAKQLPAAHAGRFLTVLRNYTRAAPETADDRWWALWRRLREGAAAGGDAEPGAGPTEPR